jgi:alkanesulfonate monooxygenase SsuD/methylene tetrahydromethanopterin reductase-like flavin-dependent oxidoreductase (luciferase family)
VTETTAGEQIEIWKKELAIAMADEQWRRALQLCSWLRYTLRQQELSDPEMEEVHRQAKEALAKQVSREKTQQQHEERHRQLRREIMHQIVSGDWEQALDSIEALYQDGANRQEAIHLLQELKARLPTTLTPEYRQAAQRAALGQRLDELVERIGGGR